MKSQYVIWGVAPGGDMEVLLASEAANIFGIDVAKEVCAVLTHTHGCTAVRAQRLEPLTDAREVAAMFRNA